MIKISPPSEWQKKRLENRKIMASFSKKYLLLDAFFINNAKIHFFLKMITCWCCFACFSHRPFGKRVKRPVEERGQWANQSNMLKCNTLLKSCCLFKHKIKYRVKNLLFISTRLILFLNYDFLLTRLMKDRILCVNLFFFILLLTRN